MARGRWIVGVVLLLIALPTVAVAVARSTPYEQRPSPTNLFEVTIEGVAADPTTGVVDHTLYRPTELGDLPFKMPIVTFAPGGCRRSNQEFFHLLSQLASQGYIVVANGAPNYPFVVAEVDGVVTAFVAPFDSAKLTRAIDWAFAENSDPTSPFHARLDTTRVAVMGQSCGGGEAVFASLDRRVTASILLNPFCPREECRNLTMHAPSLIVSGGEGDDTYVDSKMLFESIGGVPLAWADNPRVGHVGMYEDTSRVDTGSVRCCTGPVDGSSVPLYLNEPVAIASKWLSLTFYGDRKGRDYFLGAGCGLCTRGEWTVKTRGWSTN